MFFLDMEQITEGNTTTSLPWVDVGQPSFTVTNYQPVMALAQNHIQFMNVPGSTAGDAYIFVIHCMYQTITEGLAAYELRYRSLVLPTHSSGLPFIKRRSELPRLTWASNGLLPINGGKSSSMSIRDNPENYLSMQVQQEFAFIPDDGSATYVVNVEVGSLASYHSPLRNRTRHVADEHDSSSCWTFHQGLRSDLFRRYNLSRPTLLRRTNRIPPLHGRRRRD